MANLQIRIDELEKNRAQAVLKAVGLDLSGAVKIFLKAVIRTHGIPFPITTENGFSPAFESKTIAVFNDAKKHPEKLKKLDLKKLKQA